MSARVTRTFVLLLIVGLLGRAAVHAQECTDVHVVFARGSTEPQGLGICGKPLVSGIQSNLQGKTVSSHAVVYGALASQTSAGPGATAMTKHVVEYAAKCPNAVFVLGGYSQGGSVTDIAIGIKTALGTGQTIPTELAPRIKAIVVFGNPLKLFRQTIATASSLYGSKAIEFCNTGDPVCGAGVNMLAHLTYATDGSVTKAAKQAAQLVGSGAATKAAPAAAATKAPAKSTAPAPAAESQKSTAPASFTPAAANDSETPNRDGDSAIGGLIPSSGGDGSSGIMSKLSGLFSGGGSGGLSGLSGLFSGGSGSSGLSGLSGLFSGGGGSGLSGLSGLFSGGGSGLSGLFSGGGARSYDFSNLRGADDNNGGSQAE